jgi:hypothetical protein
VEAVEDEADVRMIDVAHQAPRVAVIVDMAAPGQRFVANPHLMAGGQLAKRRQVVDHGLPVGLGRRGAVGAQQDQVGAQLRHHVELAGHAIEGPGAQRLRQALEVPEGLEQRHLHAQVAHHAAHVARRAREGEQIVLEDLHCIEAGRGHGT